MYVVLCTLTTNFLVLHLEFSVFLCVLVLGLPIRPVVTHQALQMTRSNVYHIPYEGTIGKHTVDAWSSELSKEQIQDILSICGPLMAQLGYR